MIPGVGAVSPGILNKASRAQLSLEPLRCTLVPFAKFSFPAGRGLFALVCLALGFEKVFITDPALVKTFYRDETLFHSSAVPELEGGDRRPQFLRSPFRLAPKHGLQATPGS